MDKWLKQSVGESEAGGSYTGGCSYPLTTEDSLSVQVGFGMSF